MTDDPSSLRAFFAAWELFGDPTLTGALCGALLGFLGVYIDVRRMVFLSAAMSQAAGLCVAAAWYAQIAWSVPAAVASPTNGAAIFTVFAALALMGRRAGQALRSDSVLGLVYLVTAAATLAIGTRIVQEVQDIESILFGSGVAVAPGDFHLVAWMTLLLGLPHLWLHRGFAQIVLDRDSAQVRGLPVRTLDLALVLSLALAVSVSTRVLGALPVFAFTVLPAMAALRVAANLSQALVAAALVGAVSGFVGYLLAFSWKIPVGAAQTLVAAACFGLCAAVGLARRTVLVLQPRHVHGPQCGHALVAHGDHHDYVVDGRLQHPHEGHEDDHGALQD